MAVKKIVFLSDIHIGTNDRTNWYQKSVHEPYLIATLEYIHDTAASISELILLGDLVDLWTYRPGIRPPSAMDVYEANPNIFGPTGALTRVLAPLDGQVTFLNGNHDMTLTNQEVAMIRDTRGNFVRRWDGLTYDPPAGGGKIFCTHGHMFSVYCGPDVYGFEDTLPLGYFVTRMAAQWDYDHLKPGQTAANLPNTGTPTGWKFDENNVKRILKGILEGADSLAELTFDVIVGDPNVQRKQYFTLPNGKTINAYELAKGRYNSAYDNWTAWAAKQPSKLFGDLPGPYALREVDFSDSLMHFAEEAGGYYKVSVMGHTHVPEDETADPSHIHPFSESLYVNCGFNCPSVPDINRQPNPKHPTFVELEIDDVAQTCTAIVRYVEYRNGSYQVIEKPLKQKTISLT